TLFRSTGGKVRTNATASNLMLFTTASQSASPTRAKYVLPPGPPIITIVIAGSLAVTTPAIVVCDNMMPFNPCGCGQVGTATGGPPAAAGGVTGFGIGLTKGSRRPREA